MIDYSSYIILLIPMKTRSWLICLIIVIFSSSLAFAANEREWQEAWNIAFAHGSLEVQVTYGRVDILSDEYAIEVDHVKKFHEGIGQALHYAYETGKKPGLALFIDGEGDTMDKYKYAKHLANLLGIEVWLMNDVVNPNKQPKEDVNK